MLSDGKIAVKSRIFILLAESIKRFVNELSISTDETEVVDDADEEEGTMEEVD